MRFKPALFAITLAASAAPLSAQILPRDPSTRRPTQSGTIADIIFGDGTGTIGRRESCRVRDARTPDGRIVQICDDRRARRGHDDEDSDSERRRDGRGRRPHVNDRDGDGDFDARDREIRKAEKDRLKAEKKRAKAARRDVD
jgi:hypothetical protein